MATTRIQDLSENWKPDTNENFALTFTGNGETKTRLRDLYYSLIPDGAATHNSIFRGQNLGNLTATHIANIQNGSFKDMFIGDFFSINGSNYVIAGINYKKGHGDNISLGNHLLLMPQDWSKTPSQTLAPNGKDTHYMNDTDTTEGGFANTKLYKTYLPQIQQKLESDFGSHLMQWRGIVSTHVDDDTGAPDQGEWRDMKVMIPTEVMIYGTTLNGNNKNNAWYNVGDDNSQLPIMRLNDTERNFNRGAIWLRDIHSSAEFAYAGDGGVASWAGASSPWFGVRAFFLIG